MKFRESLISAHHNYLVNQMSNPRALSWVTPTLTMNFSSWGRVTPPESKPTLYGRFFNEKGVFVLRFAGEEIVENPGGCMLQKMAGGFRILRASGRTPSFRAHRRFCQRLSDEDPGQIV